MLLSTKRVKIMLLLMLYRDGIPCYLSLILKYLDWKLSNNNMCVMHDVLQHCKEGKTWDKFVLNDGFVFCANKLCILDSSVRLLLL
jgi:hypothetical protein